MEFDETSCNECMRCNTSPDQLPGYDLDCTNIAPAKSTNFLCVEFSDENIQELLVDTTFASQPFDWSAAQVDGDSDQGGDGDSPAMDDKKTDSGAQSFVVLGTGAILMGALSLQY